MSEPTRHPDVLPHDRYNADLLATVHPQGWQNPTPPGRYNLVVIGGGTAGLVCAAGAAGLGARVALIERHLLGGDCLNFGCVPSKAVISAARAWKSAAGAAAFGMAPRAASEGDFSVVMERMRRLRATIAPHDGAARFRDLGIDVFLGDARFNGPRTIEVAGATLDFRRAVIATGARASAPAIPGLDTAGYLTNETVFGLERLPERLVVVGGGPIGCEMAQAFARFGSRVTILDAGQRILPRDDADAAAVVAAALARDDVRYVGNARILEVRRRDDERAIHYEQDGKSAELACDALLVATGRTPNVEGLGLEQAGVVFGPDGIRVDERMRTTNRRVYACGDVASTYRFTHAADAQARIVIQNALFFGRAKASRLVVPWCTFTSPEVAQVGLSQEDAVRRGQTVDVVTVALAEVDRAVLDGETDGFVRIILAKGSDEILGATLVAERAGDMIGELALAVTAGVGLAKIASTIHPYPTQAEIVKKAADAWRRTKLTPRVRRVFDRWFRLTR